MKDRPGKSRLARQVACALTMGGCVATAAFTTFMALIAFRIDWGRDEAIRTAACSGALALASAAAAVLLRVRVAGTKGVAIRAVVSLCCVGASISNVLHWGGFDALLIVISPTLAAACIWLTPGPLPSFYCRKCRYDMRGVPNSVCPECGTTSTRAAPAHEARPVP